MALVLLSVACVWVVASKAETTVQVKVNEGLLEGELVHNDFGGGTYYSFKGIPYAQPPLGDLRFKAPQPPNQWEGVRSAKEFGPMCYQYELFAPIQTHGGSEDCLYLNVYTPDVKPKEPLPVMFWIHGGGFISGSGEDNYYGPKFLVSKGVIIVTINYRLEVLGFLSLNSEDVPGNAGMKDQVEALRWVNNNIASFGGDPNNITIFGESAGGVSVSYHLISPMSKGLFQRAIAQSGVSLCYWARAYHPRERALALARKLGFYSEDDKELYEFFKNQPVESLIKQSVPITFSEKERTHVEVYFGIADEKQFGNTERFFYGDVIDVMSNRIHEEVDIMTGYTADEGLMALAIFGDIDKRLDIARNYPQFFVSYPMSLNLPVDDQLELGRKIRKHYFNDQIRIPEDWEYLQKYYAMDMFVFGTMRWIKMCARSKNNKSYLYKFTCTSELNKSAHKMGLASLLGDEQVVSHGDDLNYLFNVRDINATDIKPSTFQYIERVTKLWTNFAKYGDPTPDESLGAKWTPYTLEKQDYLDIGNELAVGTAPDEEEIQFWENIFKEFGQKLY